MAVRNESVRLSLIDGGFTTGMAKAAAATAFLERSLDDLDGTTFEARRNLVVASRDVDTLGSAFRRNNSDLNQFTGRVRLFADAAVTLGPALIPIGAVAVPAVTGLAAAFGFAATGATTAIVAFQGVGSALEKVRKAQLEPTAANLEAARQAMQQIAPPARDFVRELTAMGPAFKAVRDAAASGLFPGLVESLDHVEEVLPRVATLFEAVGAAVGGLAADGAESLAGPRWAEFIEFMEVEAPRAIVELGHTLGDLTHGLAELWLAFTPINQDFSLWLRGVARSFDEWASGLDQTQGFQEFVSYLRENGPKVADAMGAIANALVQIVQAAAPLGGPVLQAVTQLANALATLADSDLGTPIFATVAALSALSRVSKLLGGGATGVAGFVTSLRQLALIGTFAGAVKGIQLLDGALQDLFNRNFDESQLSESIQALVHGRVPEDLEKMTGHLKNLDARFLQLQDSAVGWLPGQTAVEEATEEIGKLDDELANLVDGGHADEAAAAFRTIMDEARAAGVGTDTVTEAFSQYLAALDNLNGAATRGANLRDFFLQGADAAREMSGATRDLNGALGDLSGWLDKREAMRGFEDAMKELNRSLDQGKVNQWAEGVDRVGRSLVQVAEHLKGGARLRFIDETIAGLRKVSEDAGPKAKAEVGKLIRELEKLGGTKAEPKVGAKDEEFRAKEKGVRDDLSWLDRAEANPLVGLLDRASGPLGSIKRALDSIPAYKEITIATKRIGSIFDADGGFHQDGIKLADGGYGTDGRYYTRRPQIVPGGANITWGEKETGWEAYISGKPSERSRNIDILGLAAARLGVGLATHVKSFASGGVAGSSGPVGGVPAYLPINDMVNEVDRFRRATGGVVDVLAKWLREELKAAERRRDALKEDLDAIRDHRNALRDAARSLSDSIASQFSGSDLFGAEGADFASILSGLKTEAGSASQFASLALRLKALGLDGGALQALLETGNLSLLQDFAAQGSSQLAAFEAQFNQTQQFAQRAGDNAVTAVLGEQLAQANAELRRANERAERADKRVERYEKQMEKHAREAPEKTGAAVGDRINRASANAQRRPK